MGIHKISDEHLAEFKKLCEEKGIKYETEYEYEQAARNLVDFVSVLVDIDMEERKRKARLEKEPKVFLWLAKVVIALYVNGVFTARMAV